MSRYDESIVDSQWYSNRPLTPWVDPGTPAWWKVDRPTTIKVEPEADIMPTAGPSLSDKAKQRLVHSGEATTLDRPGPSRSRRPKPAETAKEIDGDEDQGDAEAPKQTGKRKGNSGPKRRMEERDRTQQASQGAESSDAKQEPEDRPVKRAKANPPTEAPRAVEACPRCIKQGRPCINEPGRACEQCKKSKVKCPLFKGERGKSRAPTEARTSVKRERRRLPTEAPTSVERGKSRLATPGLTGSMSGTSRANTVGPHVQADADVFGSEEFGFAKAMRPPPGGPLASTSARPRTPPSARKTPKSRANTPQAPKSGSRKSARVEAKAQMSEEVPGAAGSARRTRGMSTVCYNYDITNEPTKAPRLRTQSHRFRTTVEWGGRSRRSCPSPTSRVGSASWRPSSRRHSERTRPFGGTSLVVPGTELVTPMLVSLSQQQLAALCLWMNRQRRSFQL